MGLSLVIGIVILSLTGCSELRVMGRRAVQEIQTECISVERALYSQQDDLSQLEKKASAEKSASQLRQNQEQRKSPQGNYKKGLWEGR